jgi:hypothetical protein
LAWRSVCLSQRRSDSCETPRLWATSLTARPPSRTRGRPRYETRAQTDESTCGSRCTSLSGLSAQVLRCPPNRVNSKGSPTSMATADTFLIEWTHVNSDQARQAKLGQVDVPHGVTGCSDWHRCKLRQPPAEARRRRAPP